MSVLELSREDFEHWDQTTRTLLDCHLERGTISVVPVEETWNAISVAQHRVRPFFIVGRALQQRRKGNDDFRIRQIEGSWEEHKQAFFAYLVAAFHEHSPAAGRPRALIVPRWMLSRLLTTAMTAFIAGAVSFEPVADGTPRLLFLGVPVVDAVDEEWL